MPPTRPSPSSYTSSASLWPVSTLPCSCTNGMSLLTSSPGVAVMYLPWPLRPSEGRRASLNSQPWATIQSMTSGEVSQITRRNAGSAVLPDASMLAANICSASSVTSANGWGVWRPES